MGIKITDMTATPSADGTEIIPVSKAAAPKSVTAAKIKDYVVDSIEAIAAGTTPTGSDSVFVLQGGALKPIDIDLVAQHAIDTVWAKATATPVGADAVPMKTAGGVEKTITVTALAEAVRGLIQAAILDVSDLSDGSGTLATTDYMLVTQGTTGKRITVQNLYDAIYTGLAAHVAAKSDVVTGQATDTLYMVRSGTPYKITLTEIATYVATTALIDGTGVAGQLASWTDANTLAATYGVVTEGTGIGSGTDTDVPTTAAVRDAMDTVIYDSADIGAAVVDADTILIDDGAAGTTQRKSAISRLWTWLKLKTDLPLTMLDIDAGTDIGADLADADLLIVDDGAAGTNRKTAMSRVWTYVLAKLQAITNLALTTLDLDGATDIGADLVDGDLIFVDDGANGTNRKSAISRLWTYIKTKTDLPVAMIDLDAATDIGAALADADLILVDDGAGGTNRKAAMSRLATYIATYPQTETIWIPAALMWPSVTAGATANTIEYGTNDLSHKVMTFAGLAADTAAEFNVCLPSWSSGNLWRAKLLWTNGHADANPNEYVGFYFSSKEVKNDGALDYTPLTEYLIEDQLIVDDDLHEAETAVNMTDWGNTGAAKRMIHCKLRRDFDYAGAGAAMDVGAHVFGIMLYTYRDTAPT